MIVDNSKRNINIDLVKSLAVCSVVSVHFFLNSGFYDASLHGLWGGAATFLRTLFMVCVPLFLITTGFLMKNKILERKYYVGVTRTILIYLLASIACILSRVFIFKQDLSFFSAILSVFDFSGCGYAWYVEMYLGLFLLIPFLNIVYRGLDTKKNRQILLLTMVFVVALPPVLNFKYQILPAWWVSGLYPILYYYVGAYLRDYPPSVRSKFIVFCAFIGWVFLCAVFNYYLCINSKGNEFGWNAWTGWGSLENFLSAVLLFVWVQSLQLKNCTVTSVLITKISKYSLGAYLTSWIFDKAFYPILLNSLEGFVQVFPYFIVIVPLVIVCALLLSALITEIAERIAIPLERCLKKKLL